MPQQQNLITVFFSSNSASLKKFQQEKFLGWKILFIEESWKKCISKYFWSESPDFLSGEPTQNLGPVS